MTTLGGWGRSGTGWGTRPDDQYDAESNLVAQVYPNGTQAVFGHDSSGPLTGITDSLGQTQFLTLGYTRDPNGQLTSDGGKGFGYDSTNRLTSSTASGSTTTYGYD